MGYLQVQLESLTRDYQDQIQRVVRAGRKPGISGSQGKRSIHSTTNSYEGKLLEATELEIEYALRWIKETLLEPNLSLEKN